MATRVMRPDDLESIQRIWREVGWVDDSDEEHLPDFLADAQVRVATLDGTPEASGSVHRGTLRHTGTDLDTAVVTSITTSRVGRRQGLARAVLDDLVLDAAADGAALAVLGMFEQGFYDRSGFGTGAEQVFHRLDPASLPADLPHRRPVRLTADDAEEMTAALLARDRGHGGVAIPSSSLQRAERSWESDGFGLGHRDDAGTLTHFVWCEVKGEHGPYVVRSWAWRSPDQLVELLGLLRSLADQVRWVRIPEPWCLQLQVLTSLPGRQHLLTRGTPNEYRVTADAWWQARMLDVPACVAALRAAGPLRIDLSLTDPLAGRGLDAVAGDWTLELRPDGSRATRGHSGDAPHLVLSVSTFTRLWLGVREPSAVLATDGIGVDGELATALDAAVRLPRPDVGNDF